MEPQQVVLGQTETADGCFGLIDCGFYQGSREMEQANADFGFDPAKVNNVDASPGCACCFP